MPYAMFCRETLMKCACPLTLSTLVLYTLVLIWRVARFIWFLCLILCHIAYADILRDAYAICASTLHPDAIWRSALRWLRAYFFVLCSCCWCLCYWACRGGATARCRYMILISRALDARIARWRYATRLFYAAYIATRDVSLSMPLVCWCLMFICACLMMFILRFHATLASHTPAVLLISCRCLITLMLLLLTLLMFFRYCRVAFAAACWCFDFAYDAAFLPAVLRRSSFCWWRPRHADAATPWYCWCWYAHAVLSYILMLPDSAIFTSPLFRPMPSLLEFFRYAMFTLLFFRFAYLPMPPWYAFDAFFTRDDIVATLPCRRATRLRYAWWCDYAASGATPAAVWCFTPFERLLQRECVMRARYGAHIYVCWCHDAFICPRWYARYSARADVLSRHACDMHKSGTDADYCLLRYMPLARCWCHMPVLMPMLLMLLLRERDAIWFAAPARIFCRLRSYFAARFCHYMLRLSYADGVAICWCYW